MPARIGVFVFGFLAAGMALAGYSAPRDFAGYRWQSRLSEFSGLELLGADIAELATGRHVLAQYRAPPGSAEVSGMRPAHISYLFCGTRAAPGFCGVVLRFDDQDGSFERVVADLTERHGEPAVDETQFPVARYVWGGKGRNDVAPVHAVAITMTFEPRTGRGEIIYATQELYRLAYRIHAYGEPDYYLYRLLEGRLEGQQEDRPEAAVRGRHSNPRVCTGRSSCANERRPLSQEELAELEPGR